jgi:hypothetical protein
MVEPWKGLAKINPSDPQTLAICDRCGRLEKLNSLRPQAQWAGTQVIDLGILVCDRCYDDPSAFLGIPRIPADPDPILNGRLAPFSIFEKNEYTLKPAGLGVPMFGVASSFSAVLIPGLGFSAAMSVLSGFTVSTDLFLQIITNNPVELLTEDGFDILTEDGLFYIGTENTGFGVTSVMSASLQLN